MLAISLWQPWATAMAMGLKRIETRHWRPPVSVRVPCKLAIHAAKRWTREEREFFIDMRAAFPTLPPEVPLGQIVAVCTLAGFQRTEGLVDSTSRTEQAWGNYEEGRWGWVCQDIVALPMPIPFIGRQGFFTVPDSILDGLVAGSRDLLS